MSSIIEANAYAQDFPASDVTVTDSNTRLQALMALLVVMVIVAFAGIIFTAPYVTLAAAGVVATTIAYGSYISLRDNN